MLSEKRARETSKDEAVWIPTDDGRRLAGRWRWPDGAPTATVVIHGATGVGQSYYRHFAAWLAEEHGVAALTYDYRDFEESLEGDIRRSDATFSCWGFKDQPAALAHAVERSRKGRVSVIGHSLGGMFINQSPLADKVDRAATIGSGEGHFLAISPVLAPASFNFWFGFGPMLVMTHGYLPGRFSGIGRDLPAGVFWEWRRWCSEPGYSGRATPPPPKSRSRRRFPIRMIGVEDDLLIRPDGVSRLGERFEGHPVEQHLLAPEDVGLKQIGHMGAFTRSCASAWPVLADAIL